MSVATDLSTQEAGEAFARLSVLTETPVDQMENLGSAINALSNEMATSSGEIVDSMLRSSAALNQFGLNNRQIVGMSAALNEVSESSRRAGSRLRRVAQELLDPRKVGDVARALGMTEAEFKNLRREQPDQIMLRLAEAFAEGGRTAEELRGTLSTASRQAVAGLAQNLDGLRTALQRSNETFAEGTSLQKEFDAATQTFNSRMQVLKNNINEVAITIGNDLLPVLNPLLETLNDLISGSEDLEATFGTETAEDIRGITSAFDDLVGPVEDNAEEILDLSTKLFILGQGVLPHVAPALRDMRFVLEGTASALQTVNDALDRSLELWDDLPPSLREAAIEGATTAATAPIGGPSTLRGVRAARRGIEESDQTLSAATATSVTGADARREGDQIIITVEGDTDVIRNVTAEQMTREGNRVFAETGSR
jgi:TP901 family phage tail tape measure protein